MIRKIFKEARAKKKFIEALKKVKEDFIEEPRKNLKGICVEVSSNMETKDYFLFKNWFTPDKFGISMLYPRNGSGIPIEQVCKNCYGLYYWFDFEDDIHITNGKRLMVIDKAIALLEQETKFTYQVMLILKTIKEYGKRIFKH